MNIRIADIVNDSIVDGPGIRLTIFVQGCTHKCRNCHNPSTHDLNGGKVIEISEILKSIDENILLDGVTFSGGEPLLQVQPLAELAEEIKKRNLNLIVYTGYTWEEIIKNKKKYINLLKYVDFLIDGLFVEQLKSLELNFKGSSNQRTIDVQKSLNCGDIVLYEF